MRVFIFIAVGLTAFLFSFSIQDREGKILFDHNCGGCHYPNKVKELSPTQFAPSFQNIRKDYGLSWTVSFIKNNYKMLYKKDTRTLYSYYYYGKVKHISFPVFEQKNIIKILDYVDSYPNDSTQYKHRFVSATQKLKYVNDQLLKDTIKEPTVVFGDTASFEVDTTSAEPSRVGRRRGPPKKQQ